MWLLFPVTVVAWLLLRSPRRFRLACEQPSCSFLARSWRRSRSFIGSCLLSIFFAVFVHKSYFFCFFFPGGVGPSLFS